jgi:hypothetical protein
LTVKLRTLRRLVAIAVPAAALVFSSSAFAQEASPGSAPAAPAAPVSQPAPAAEPAPAPVQEGTATGTAPDQVDPAIGIAATQNQKDEAQAAANPDKKDEDKLPFRGSTLLLDQSMTTNTAHLEPAQQLSYVPTYEWWISFRPRWYFTDHLYYQLRADYYKEFTNSNQTTDYRADVFGDIWNTLGYKTPISEKLKNTKVSASIQALLPTSKESQDAGIYVTVGAGAGISQDIKLNGEDAKFFPGMHLGLSALYRHPFSKAIVATNGDLNYTRQSVEGFSFLSDQLSGSTLTNHSLYAFVDAGIDITKKLSFSMDMIWINGWKYAPADNQSVQTATGDTAVPRNSDSTTFTQATWFIADVDYELFDELTLGLGYYNLQNVIAPDGTRRGIFSGDNVWWSPDARVFFDMTVNLDKVYERFAGTKKPKNENASTKPPSQGQRWANTL